MVHLIICWPFYATKGPFSSRKFSACPENFWLSARSEVRELNGPTSLPQKISPPACYSAAPIRNPPPAARARANSPHSLAFNAAAAQAKNFRHLNACSTEDQIFLGSTGNVWQSENFWDSLGTKWPHTAPRTTLFYLPFTML